MKNTDELRIPPNSVTAEQSLLAGLLLDNGNWYYIEELLAEDDFYQAQHRVIFQHIQTIIKEGKRADIASVAERIDAEEGNEVTSTLSHLEEIVHNPWLAANIYRDAEVVRELSLLRRLASVADEIAAEALSPLRRRAEKILDDAEQKILAITEPSKPDETGFVRIEKIAAAVVARVSERHAQKNPKTLTGLSTGFDDFDKITSGLQPGDVIVVAGRPAMGKTALAMSIAEYVAVESDISVAIFSIDMDRAKLCSRFLASMSRIYPDSFSSGKLSEDEWLELSNSLGRLKAKPLFIDETGGLTPRILRAKARRLQHEHGKLGLIVIDYLQLMATDQPGKTRAAEISEISRSIKSLAKELGVPIIVLSQLSHKLERRNDKRPVLSDLRSYGGIEQYADVILMMFREDYYDYKMFKSGLAEMIVCKNRRGKSGTFNLCYQNEYIRFVSPDTSIN